MHSLGGNGTTDFPYYLLNKVGENNSRATFNRAVMENVSALHFPLFNDAAVYSSLSSSIHLYFYCK